MQRHAWTLTRARISTCQPTILIRRVIFRRESEFAFPSSRQYFSPTVNSWIRRKDITRKCVERWWKGEGEREREDDRPKYGSVNDDRRRRDGERREREKGKFVPGPPCGNYLSLVLDESTVTNRQPGKILPFIVAPFGLAILHPRQPATAAPLTTFISDCSFAALYAHCR